MVAWFIVAIITIGLFAVISLNGVGLVTNAQNSGQRAETVRRMDAIMTALQAQSAAPLSDGVVYAPAGTTSDQGYTVPRSLLPSAITPFGAKFVYCPMGQALASQNDTVSYPGGSYGISTFDSNGRSYVTTGRVGTAAAGDPNVIGFVIAPVSPEAAAPGCGDVVRNGELYTAPNGIVRTLRRDSIANVDVVRSSGGGNWYVAPNGTGNGQSPGTPASASAAMAAYRQSVGGNFTIVFAAGSYSVDGNPLDQSVTSMQSKKENSALILRGVGSATLSLGSAINVPGNLEMSNVTVEGTTTFATAGHYDRIVNSALGPIVAQARSRFLLVGSNSVRGISGNRAAINQLSGSTVLVPSSNLTVYYVANAPAWYLENGASSTVSASNVTIAPAASMGTQSSLLILDPNSAYVLKSSTINFNGASTYALAVSGRLTAYTTTFNYNASTYVGIQTGNGGEVDLPDLTMRGTSPASYPISALGTSSVTGFGNIYSSERCWYRGNGSVFRYSPVGVQGTDSKVTADEVLPTMSPQPTAAEVRRYQSTVARNTDKSVLRSQLNASRGVDPGFTCQQSSAPVYTICAGEGGYCNGFNAYTIVRYGAGSSYNYRYVAPEEGTPCDNATFGDPLVGTVKTCSYLQ